MPSPKYQSLGLQYGINTEVLAPMTDLNLFWKYESNSEEGFQSGVQEHLRSNASYLKIALDLLEFFDISQILPTGSLFAADITMLVRQKLNRNLQP